jgi:choline dehydrogenase-like flavoprotein
MPSRGPNATTMMLGERLADLLLDRDGEVVAGA